MWNFIWTLFLIIRLVAAVNLTVPDPIISGVSTQIVWTTSDEDPEKWDLRLVVNTKDLGLAMANVDTHGEQFGTTEIRVNKTGTFKLVAVGPSPNFHQIGSSNWFNVEQSHLNSAPVAVVSTPGASPSFTIDPTYTASQPSLVSSSVPTTVVAPVSASTQPEPRNTSLIIGVTIGSSTLVVGGVLFLIIRRRRRRSTKARNTFTFNREFMFQRRPSTYDTWTLRSVDLEKGIRGPSPQIFVTKTTTRDTDF